MQFSEFADAVGSLTFSEAALYAQLNSMSVEYKNENARVLVSYDIKDLDVLEIIVHDLIRDKAYRWKHHACHVIEPLDDEAALRSKAAITDCPEDILAKVKAIINNSWYDDRIVVTFDVPEVVKEILHEKAREAKMFIDDYIAYIIQEEVNLLMKQEQKGK